MLLVLSFMFFTFAASIGTLYYIDKREKARKGARTLDRIRGELLTLQ